MNGKGTPQNFDKAFEFHSLAAEWGNVDAIFEIAMAYYNGNGTNKDRVKAFLLLNSAKDKDNFNASKFLEESYYKDTAENVENQFKLGNAYEFAENLKKDLNQAIFWYEKAVVQNSIEANYRLAHCHLNKNKDDKYYE